MAEPISIATGRPREELRIRTLGDQLDVRIFSAGAGPAQIGMPTGRGFAIPVGLLGTLIAGLSQAETANQSKASPLG